MDSTFLITAFVTLLVVIDPVALAPLFIALTKGTDDVHRRAVALRASLVAIMLLTAFGLLGEAVLEFIGISIHAFRIAGGILLFLTALDMLFERRTPRRQSQHANASDPSVFPLAMPLIAGPGAMATMILLVGQATDWQGIIAVHVVMVAVVALSGISFLGGGAMERALGETGINVTTRLLGMLLAALSVQFVLDGLAGFGLAAGMG